MAKMVTRGNERDGENSGLAKDGKRLCVARGIRYTSDSNYLHSDTLLIRLRRNIDLKSQVFRNLNAL